MWSARMLFPWKKSNSQKSTNPYTHLTDAFNIPKFFQKFHHWIHFVSVISFFSLSFYRSFALFLSRTLVLCLSSFLVLYVMMLLVLNRWCGLDYTLREHPTSTYNIQWTSERFWCLCLCILYAVYIYNLLEARKHKNRGRKVSEKNCVLFSK